MPMSADPASCITVRTSAKSRLMRPGVVIRSQIPCTPWRSTSSAILKASTIEVERSSTSSSRSFGMTMTVSHAARSSSTPLSAALRRRVPSNRNGVVTIPTVSAPSSRAIRATTGAAPEPVPPPSPAVTKTMSEPRSARLIASYPSSAERRPISGSAPEPSPSVSSLPMWILVAASLICSCWMSVLTAMKSTWTMPASIIRSTAFRPAPPTPTTRRDARYDAVSRARSSRAGCSGSGSSQRASGRSRRSTSGSGSGSGAGATARIGVGETGGSSAATGCRGSGSVGSCCCASAPLFCFCAASVARKSSASGPSRMLARFLAIEHLLCEIAVHPGCLALGLVGKHRCALDGRFRETDGFPDTCAVDEVAEVLAQDLVCFARVRDATVVHRRDDADDLDARVQVLAHHRERVLELHESAQREVLGLHRDDDAGGGDERVDGQQPERRGRVDEDVVVAAENRRERLLERALPADLARQRHVGACEVDRRDGDVGLPGLDHLLDRQAVHEHVEHRLLDRVWVQPLRHREVALRVEVDQEHLEALLGERHAQVQRRRRLRDTALLVRKHDHLRVGRGRHASRPYIGTRKEAGKTHLRAPFLFRLPHSFCLLPKFRRSDARPCVTLGARPRLGFRNERPQLAQEHARRPALAECRTLSELVDPPQPCQHSVR